MRSAVTAARPPSHDDPAPRLHARTQLGVPVAIVDGLCLSALLWMVLVALLR